MSLIPLFFVGILICFAEPSLGAQSQCIDYKDRQISLFGTIEIHRLAEFDPETAADLGFPNIPLLRLDSAVDFCATSSAGDDYRDFTSVKLIQVNLPYKINLDSVRGKHVKIAGQLSPRQIGSQVTELFMMAAKVEIK